MTAIEGLQATLNGLELKVVEACLEGTSIYFTVYTKNHIFHGLTSIRGICFRSKQNPF